MHTLHNQDFKLFTLKPHQKYKEKVTSSFEKCNLSWFSTAFSSSVYNIGISLIKSVGSFVQEPILVTSGIYNSSEQSLWIITYIINRRLSVSENAIEK